MASSVLNSGRIFVVKVFHLRRQTAASNSLRTGSPGTVPRLSSYRLPGQTAKKDQGLWDCASLSGSAGYFVSEPWNVKATSAGHIASNRTGLSRKTDGTLHI